MLEGDPLETRGRQNVPTTAEVIAETLKARGIHRLFGLPGGEIAEIMGACRRAGLSFLLARH